VASKLTSRFLGQAHRLPFFLVAAASVSLALQLQSSYAQNAREQVTPTTGTITGPIQDKGGQIVNVKTFGAAGDGVTNDTAAFSAALKACAGGGTCLVPKGTYIISASGIPNGLMSSGVHLTGAGRGSSILKIAGVPTRPFLICDGNNWSVEDLTFDMQGYMPRTNLTCLHCKGNNWRVANCSIIGIGRFGITYGAGTNWRIEGNYISATAPTINNGAIQGFGESGLSQYGHIIHNVICGGLIALAGQDLVVSGNQITGSRGGSGIVSEAQPSTKRLNITNNICAGGRGFDGHNWISGMELWAPDGVIANNICYDNDGTGLSVGGKNSVVRGNYCFNNGAGTGGFGIWARWQSAIYNASGSTFVGNTATDTRYPKSTMTQTYGYFEQSGGLMRIRHIGNNYNGNKVGPTSYNSLYGQPNVTEIKGTSAIRNKIEALADAKDIDMSDIARRALREYLDRLEKAPPLDDKPAEYPKKKKR
jgi:hypothetical protein